jgi:drug/metabolite transporter (DMT)-like permease
MLVTSVLLIIASQICLKLSLKSVTPAALDESPWSAALTIARQPLLWVSLFMSGLVFLQTVYNLVIMPLNTFAPIFIALYFMGLLGATALFLHEPIPAAMIVGYLLIICGLMLIIWALQQSGTMP